MNWLVFSGKIEGKLYLPYKDGVEVEQNESIVEMIKDGWNVPNKFLSLLN